MQYNDIAEFLAGYGIFVSGVAAVTNRLRNGIALSSDVLSLMKSALVIGVPLARGIFENLDGGPDALYLHHYRQANFLLDRAAFCLAGFLEENGYRSIPIPASQIIDWENQRGHLSHKLFAVYAGLGWIGRNNLFVCSKYGSRLRLATVLTEAEFPVYPKMQEFSCGKCRACIDACPARAIADEPENFNHKGCYSKIREMTKERGIPQYICGICIKVCHPDGRTKET